MTLLFFFYFASVVLSDKCQDLTIDNFQSASKNSLGGSVKVGGLTKFVSKGVLNMYTKGTYSKNYYTSYLVNSACFDASKYASVKFTAAASTNAYFSLRFDQRDSSCSSLGTNVTSAQLALTTTPKTFNVSVPAGIINSKMIALSFVGFSAVSVNFTVSSLSFVGGFTCGIAPSVKVYEKCVNPGKIAITLDDGPYIYMQNIVDLLVSKNIVATLFINGVNYRDITTDLGHSLLQIAYNSGRLQIGNHGYYHDDMTQKTLAAQITNIKSLDDVIYSIIGVRPAFFRPPFGYYNADTITAVTSLGYKAIALWNLDSFDWSRPDNTSASYQVYLDDVAANSPSSHSSNSLMHETIQSSITTLLPEVIDLYKSKGYSFVTITECLGFSSSYQ